ncbi:MAG: hypothetical protein ACE14L_04890 [Terriglobales bacterium]
MGTRKKRNAPASPAGPEELETATAVADPPPGMDAATGEVPLTADDLAQLEKPPNVDFFDWLKQLPPKLWEDDLNIYLYRLHPRVHNAPGSRAYIGVYSYAIDAEDVKQEHGGGKYRAILKSATLREAVQSHEFAIGGQPKILDGQRVIGPGGSAAAADATAAGSPAAAPGPATENATAQIVKTVADALRQASQQGKPNDDALSTALAPIRKATETAIDIVGSAARAHIEAERPQKPTDQLKDLLELAKSLRGPERNPLEDLRNSAAILKELRGGGDDKSVLGELRDILGVEKLSDLLFDRVAGGAKSSFDWRSELLGFGRLLLQQAPAIMDRFATMQASAQAFQLRVLQMRTGQVPPPGPPTPAASSLPAAAAVPPVTVPDGIPPVGPSAVQPAAAAAGVTEEMIFDSALTLIRNCYAEGDPGDDAALVLRRTYPDLVPLFAPMLSSKSPADVIAWAKTDKVLGPAAAEPGFADFLKEFTHGILHFETPAPGCELCQAEPATEQA